MKDMKQNPDKRLMNLEHREDEPPIGEIVNCRIDKGEDGEHYLIAEIGIYQDREDIADRIEDGDLGGFSISFRNFYNIDEEKGKEKDKIGVIAVPGEYKQEIVDLVEESDAPVEVETQKSAVAPVIIGFLESNPDLVLELLLLIYGWYQAQDEEVKKKMNIEARFNFNMDLDFDVGSKAEFKKQVREELSGEEDQEES